MEGFVDPFEFCCGSFYGYRHIMCGKKATVNGTIYGNPCDKLTIHQCTLAGMAYTTLRQLTYGLQTEFLMIPYHPNDL